LPQVIDSVIFASSSLPGSSAMVIRSTVCFSTPFSRVIGTDRSIFQALSRNGIALAARALLASSSASANLPS